MTTTTLTPSPLWPRALNPAGLLALGASLTVLAHFRFGIDVLGWIAPVPFLLYLRRSEGWRSRAAFAATLLVVWTLGVAKIVTDPIPLAMPSE